MAGEKETVHTEEGKTFRQIPLGTSVEDNSQDQFPTHNPSRPSGRGIRRAYSSSAKISIPAAPRSNNFRLPLKMPDVQANLSQTKSPKRLLHPSLERIPMQVRFGLNGFLTNVSESSCCAGVPLIVHITVCKYILCTSTVVSHETEKQSLTVFLSTPSAGNVYVCLQLRCGSI